MTDRKMRLYSKNTKEVSAHTRDSTQKERENVCFVF